LLAELAQAVDDVIVIDHGRLMVHGAMSDLLQAHRSSTLEDLFFDLTSKESLS
jgi:ABC-2 type transport system ATP-binding protein